MIDAKDLRIGNYVLCNGLRTIVNESIMISIIQKDIQWTIEPIELTEEWLLKFGFEFIKFKDSSNCCGGGYFYDSLDKDVFRFKILENGKFKIIWYNLNGVRINSMSINYVHQMQNIYYALTKKELTTTLANNNLATNFY